MYRPVSYIPIRKPMKRKLDTCNQVTLTSCERWDPDLFLTNESYKLSDLYVTHNDIRNNVGTNLFTVNAINNYISSIIDHVYCTSSLRHSEKREISSSNLSKLWDIPFKVAKRTLDTAKNFSYSSVNGTFTRRRRASHCHFEHLQLSGHLSCFCTDTFPSNVISLRGNSFTQLYTNRGNFTRPYHMKSKGYVGLTFHRFIAVIGAPSEILLDGPQEFTLSYFGKLCQKSRILQTRTEPHSPW